MASDIVFVLFTSVTANSSEVYGIADGMLLREIFGEDLPVLLEGMMSRKKISFPGSGPVWENGRS